VATVEPYQGWAAGGAMALTGEEAGPPRAPGWAIASAMAGAAAVFGLCTELLGCPHSRPASGTARPVGADTDAVLGELGCR
jgi:hypothetical protein